MRDTSSLQKSCQPSVYYTKMVESCQVPFPTARQVNLPACSPHCSFKCSTSSSEAAKTYFKVISLTPLGIKPKSTALEADALTTRPTRKYSVNIALQEIIRLKRQLSYEIRSCDALQKGESICVLFFFITVAETAYITIQQISEDIMKYLEYWSKRKFQSRSCCQCHH